MRRARRKSSEGAFYHIITRVAGTRRYFPLQRPEASRKLIEMIHFYTRAYCCRLVSFTIMGNHYHFILWMDKFRLLSRQELRHRAHLLYGKRAEKKTAGWSNKDWEAFNRKLFDLSALMQHLNGEYAKWFNRRYDRRGHFWGDRFKNVHLVDLKAVQDCLIYIETNPIRAHLVDRPEQWKASSAWVRRQPQANDLMAIEEIFPNVPRNKAFEFYCLRLDVRREKDRHSGKLAEQWLNSRHRYFSDGLVVSSSREAAVAILDEDRRQGLSCRKNPIVQQDGRHYSLREQRSNARS